MPPVTLTLDKKYTEMVKSRPKKALFLHNAFSMILLLDGVLPSNYRMQVDSGWI